MKNLFYILMMLCATVNVSAATNFITNGNFEDGSTKGWTTESNEGSMNFDVTDTDPISGKNSLEILILTSTGKHDIGEDWWKQKSRFRMPIFKGAKYKVTFKAYASDPLSILCRFEKNFPDFSAFAGEKFDITTDVNTYEYITDAAPDVIGSGAFTFYFGHLTPGDQVWIDDIVVEEVEPLSSGNICNGDFEQDVTNDSYYGAAQIYGWSKHLAGAVVDYAIDEQNPISGSKSLKITAGEGTPASDGWKAQMIWAFSAVHGKKYMLEFKAKGSTDFIINAEAYDEWENDTRDNFLFNAQEFRITQELKTYKTESSSAAANLYKRYFLCFWFGLMPNGSSLWIDDIKMYQYDDDGNSMQEMTENESVFVYNQGQNIVVRSELPATAKIYSLTGQLIQTASITQGDNIIHSEDGVYVIQIEENNKIIKSSKLFIK